jgi:transcriptional regulator with XRE-family HTH domain
MVKQTPWYRRLLALAELGGDVTQDEIAERLHVSPGAVSAWKRGTPPKPESVITAAHEYGVDALEMLRIAYLSGSEDDPGPKGGQGKTRGNPNNSGHPL